MKTKIIAIILAVTLLSGLGITAGVLAIDRGSTDYELTKTETEALSYRLNLSGEIDISATNCDTITCVTHIYKTDAINTDIRTAARYCSEWSVPEEVTTTTALEGEPMEQPEQLERVCLAYTPYTAEEIKTMTDTAITKRLKGIAEAEAQRKAKSEEAVTKVINEGTGKVTTKK